MFIISGGQFNECDTGYTLLSTGCYLKTGKIKDVTTGLELCKGMGGRLVTIESSEEQSNVIGLVGNDAQGDHNKASKFILF